MFDMAATKQKTKKIPHYFYETTFGYSHTPTKWDEYSKALISESAFLGDEDEHQEAIFRWAEKQNMPVLNLLFAIPNGGKRDAITAVKLKRQGVKAGISDMFLPVARKGYRGLWIELKIKGRYPTPAQIAFTESMRVEGFKAVYCNGSDAAVMVIEEYLS